MPPVAPPAIAPSTMLPRIPAPITGPTPGSTNAAAAPTTPPSTSPAVTPAVAPLPWLHICCAPRPVARRGRPGANLPRHSPQLPSRLRATRLWRPRRRRQDLRLARAPEDRCRGRDTPPRPRHTEGRHGGRLADTRAP